MGGAVHDRIDAANGRFQRVGVEQIAHDQLDMSFAQRSGSRRVADQRTDVVTSWAALCRQALREAASDFPGGSGDEDVHGVKVATRRRRRLEETDTNALPRDAFS
jgi:ribosomal protein S14